MTKFCWEVARLSTPEKKHYLFFISCKITIHTYIHFFTVSHQLEIKKSQLYTHHVCYNNTLSKYYASCNCCPQHTQRIIRNPSGTNTYSVISSVVHTTALCSMVRVMSNECSYPELLVKAQYKYRDILSFSAYHTKRIIMKSTSNFGWPARANII